MLVAPGVIHSNQELNDLKHSFTSEIVIKAMSTIQFSFLKKKVNIKHYLINV